MCDHTSAGFATLLSKLKVGEYEKSNQMICRDDAESMTRGTARGVRWGSVQALKVY